MQKQLVEKSNEFQLMIDPKPAEAPARKITSTSSFKLHTHQRATERRDGGVKVRVQTLALPETEEVFDEFAAISIANKPVAAWRSRVHRSRRKVFLIVLTIIRYFLLPHSVLKLPRYTFDLLHF
eukprot:gene31795-6992_t